MLNFDFILFYNLNKLKIYCFPNRMLEIIKKIKPSYPYESDYKLTQEGKSYKAIGKQILTENKLSVVILAGGQGTRLGTDEPKGCYKLPGINRTLYQIHIDNIKNVMRLHKCKIPIIFMTSKYTHTKTKEFIESNSHFGIDENLFYFLMQPDYLCFNLEDEVLRVNGKDVTAPNGNGAIFLLFKESGIYDKLPAIEYFNIISVDNVLARVADPIFVGFISSKNLDCVSKSVDKREDESVGVFVQKGDNILTLEYSEIIGNVVETDNNKNVETIGTNENNESSTKITDITVFNQGNICNHIFSRSFMIQMANKNLPVHKAYKKIPYMEMNKLIKPEKENGYKCELFIFDSFIFTARNGVMNVPRIMEFSPLKNGLDKNIDNPKTAVEDLYNRSRRMISNAEICNKLKILVWPSKSVFGENLEEYKDLIIEKDTTIE